MWFSCAAGTSYAEPFFQEIDLRKELRNWDGVLVGVSAGTMNCEELVYAPPEEEGEPSTQTTSGSTPAWA